MENWDTLKATKMMEAASFIRTLMESKSRLSDSQGHLLILIQPPNFTAAVECLKAAIHVFSKHDTNQVTTHK
ncbi:MAG: hypothetical protein JWQ40_1297 [Segetibacter sp.]|nr:hypothetical protein [Segetibacter sp.]